MTNTNTAALIDAFGELKAELANLKKREDELRAEIIALGLGAHEGDLFRVTITASVRETLDMAAVREKLSPQWIRAHTNATEVVTVKATARTGKEKAA